MIFGNINHEKTYSNLDKDLLTCFEYAKNNLRINSKNPSKRMSDDLFAKK